MAKYRGSKVPHGLPRSLRRLVEAHERALRFLPDVAVGATGTTNVAPAASGKSNKALPTPQTTWMQYIGADLVQLEMPPVGQPLHVQFEQQTFVREGGNLDLASPWVFERGEFLTLMNDGRGSLKEISRSPHLLAKTFIPVREYGVVPDTGADMSALLQAAVDDPAAAGAVLVFEAGTYEIRDVRITQADMSLFLPPGCILAATSATGEAVLWAAGTLDVATAKDVVLAPGTDAAYPRGGERSIYINSADMGFFTADGWISIEDEEDVPPPGRWNGGSDPNYNLEHHMELTRIKAITDVGGGVARLDLWFPLVNTYAFVGIAPRLRLVTPLLNFHIWGGGEIQNGQAGTGRAHGLVLRDTVGAVVSEIKFTNVFNTALHTLRAQDVRIDRIECRDPPRFDSRGYGISTYGLIRGTIVNCTMRRLRHCIDVSFFSRQVAIVGCNLTGSTTSNINTHANVEGLTITGCVIDGGHQENSATPPVPPSTDYGDVGASANGINIDEMNKNVAIVGNIIRNMRRAGIKVDMGQLGFPTEFVTITGNTMENCVTIRRLTKPPSGHTDDGCILLLESVAAPGHENRGIVVRGNVLREPGQFGILCNVSGAVIEGNWIYHAADKVQATDTAVVGIGIWIRGGLNRDCLRPIVRGNFIDSSIQNAIRIGVNLGTHNVVGAVVENNVCIATTLAAIFLEETAPNTVVRYNRCEGGTPGATADGLNTQAVNGLFEGNVSVGNTGWGMRIIGGANNNVLRFNIFSGPGYANNSLGEVTDGGTSNFIVSHDLTNDRVGIGLINPAATVEIRSTTEQLRLSASAAATAFTSFIETTDATYGGLSIQPATNASGFKWVHFFGDYEGNALSFMDDPGAAQLWIRTSQAKDMVFNTGAGKIFSLSVNFGFQFIVSETDVTTFKPFTSFFQAPTNNALYFPFRCVTAAPGGGALAGLGTGFKWDLETATDGVFENAGLWYTILADPTAGSLDAVTTLSVFMASTERKILKLDGSAGTLATVVINDDATNAQNLRVEGVTDPNLLYTDPVNDRVGMGTATPASKLHVEHSDALTTADLEVFRLARISTGTPANTFGARMGMWLENGGNVMIEAARARWRWEDATNGSEDSVIAWSIYEAGNLVELMTLKSPGGATPELILHNNNSTVQQIRLFRDGSAVFNEQGNNADHRIEGDNEVNLLVVDADALTNNPGAIGIGVAAPATRLHVLLSDGSAATDIEMLRLDHRTTTTAAANFGVGIGFQLENASGSGVRAGLLSCRWETATGGSEDAYYRLGLKQAGSDIEVVRIYGSKPGVHISNNAGALPAEMLDVTDDIRSRGLRLDGDTGSGVASTVTLTNKVTAVGGATGTATLGLVGNADTPTAIAQSHWEKFYDGTTVRYRAIWT